ncbi:serine/threonine-protein kinase polo [Condylostylus longicornis]|uniref:serine/threonine-protein kinase polo n=1 Tax=Condylostylus longicornis TaxID=2530218 RepID=UPI00244E206D|nr:serine/threonine-protein kinase polo [Condylostylus longicornis]XP_055376824.1 serine/threonine-protein kinase polo [Condylostylus longicornis]
MTSRNEEKASDIPERLYDVSTDTTYKRMRFFGKGGFAKCYEIVNVATNEVFAGKIVSKKLMIKHNQRDKMTQEISIHKSLNNKNIVKFHSFFDDMLNIYIVLELCKKRSMMELHKRRKIITEYECRYYIYQIIQGVKYLHDNRIIHRDLKLGNLFLNDELHVKIGDFGLATRVEYDGERKKTLCGTPNYIAPEILTKKGHSYEVDIWSIGCVMYTLLVGQPPFETKTLKDTYTKIKKCDYKVPTFLRRSAAEMIIAMLQSDPTKRPTISDLLNYEFINSTPVPTSLPSSCLTMAPRPDLLESIDKNYGGRRAPLAEIHAYNVDDTKLELTFLKNHLHDAITASGQMSRHNDEYRNDIQSLYVQLSSLIHSKPMKLETNFGDENTDPAANPLFWVSKWVDYSDKYGFGYQLCDEGMGVMFNDTTKLIMFPNKINVHFIDKDGKETYMKVDDYPQVLEKKMKLLSYFKRYMSEHLVKAGADAVNHESDSISRIPHLHTWFRTTCAVVMHLTNGSVQLNFSDHVKIILCPRMSAVTYMDSEKHFRTYRFSTITEHGCSKDLYQKIRYAHEKLKVLIEKLS